MILQAVLGAQFNPEGAMTATPAPSSNAIKFWASVLPYGAVRYLYRHNSKLSREEVFSNVRRTWLPYDGDSFEDVLEGRYPVLTREQAAELFPHAADQLDD